MMTLERRPPACEGTNFKPTALLRLLEARLLYSTFGAALLHFVPSRSSSYNILPSSPFHITTLALSYMCSLNCVINGSWGMDICHKVNVIRTPTKYKFQLFPLASHSLLSFQVLSHLTPPG
ncbi:hypothetical protein EDB19DRAFT_1679410 [Suillus lakei]|nr:hypothetical protein EDB19DRAFT_1679410 [Suillus lakei]